MKRTLIALTALISLSACVSTGGGMNRVWRSWEGPVSPINAFIQKKLAEGKKVAVMTTMEVSTTLSDSSFLGGAKQKKEWIDVEIKAVRQTMERELIGSFGANDSFYLVDRSVVEKAIAELKLTQTGAFDQADQIKVGNFVGATHILHGNMVRGVQGSRTIDRLNMRLIDIERSTVVAIQQLSTPV